MSAARLFCAFLELIKLQVPASYVFLALGSSPPFLPYALALFLGLGLSRIARSRGMRTAAYAGLNVLGLVLSLLAVFASPRTAPFDPQGLLSGGPGTSTGLGAAVWLAVFWFRGEWLGRKKTDHAFCILRMDEGMLVILLALIIAALAGVSNPTAEHMTLPFFLFGVLALGASKQESVRAAGSSGGSGKSAVIRASAAFALASAGIVLLLPSLLEPARRANAAIGRAIRALGPLIAALLRLLFSARPPAISAGPTGTDGPGIGPHAEEMGKLGGILAHIMVWILTTLAALFFIALAIFGIAALIKRLSGRVPREGGPARSSAWIRAALARIADLLAKAGALLFRNRPPRSAAVAAYAGYLACGRRAGLPRRRNETPREYAKRLARVFPRSAGRALFVVRVLEREIYGGRKTDAKTERRLAAIRRRTRTVFFWAERFRAAAGLLN